MASIRVRKEEQALTSQFLRILAIVFLIEEIREFLMARDV
uniref:Uncharacterized protein n=1 Tax=Lepeophtheirus salmonis TaxID=72036 RepID=A0A0K2T3X3_LEPSM